MGYAYHVTALPRSGFVSGKYFGLPDDDESVNDLLYDNEIFWENLRRWPKDLLGLDGRPYGEVDDAFSGAKAVEWCREYQCRPIDRKAVEHGIHELAKPGWAGDLHDRDRMLRGLVDVLSTMDRHADGEFVFLLTFG